MAARPEIGNERKSLETQEQILRQHGIENRKNASKIQYKKLLWTDPAVLTYITWVIILNINLFTIFRIFMKIVLQVSSGVSRRYNRSDMILPSIIGTDEM